MSDKLAKLLKRCKCGVFISVNQHRDYYETVEQHFKAQMYGDEMIAEIPPEVYASMVETSTVVHIQCYPETPVSFVQVHHHNLDVALDSILASVEKCWPTTAAQEDKDGAAS